MLIDQAFLFRLLDTSREASRVVFRVKMSSEVVQNRQDAVLHYGFSVQTVISLTDQSISQ